MACGGADDAFLGQAVMPWSSGAVFARKHNRKLKGAAAGKAKSVAEAMMRRGVAEGEAIATGNKVGKDRKSVV